MEARRRRDEFAVKVRNEPLPTAAARTITLDALADQWLELQRRRVASSDLAQRTYDGYAAGLRLHVLPTLGPRRISTITAGDLADWNRQLLDAGYARDSIHAWWTPLRLVLAYAARRRVITTNPADQLLAHERPKSGAPRRRFLTRGEMDALLSAAPPRYRLAIATGLFAGLRLSEVLGLTWSDVDLGGAQLRVGYQMGRDGKRRSLKTPAARREVILMESLGRQFAGRRLASRHSAAADLVFTTVTGRGVGHRNLTARGLEAARDRAGLPDVTFHTLRHTFASMLIAQGRDPVFVARQLGHTNPAVTLRVYGHLFDAARHAHEARAALNSEFGYLLATEP
jgi:integrase